MNKAVGLLFDLSLRHAVSGERILDVVKDQSSKFLKQVLDYEDAFYLYHPLLDECVYKTGEIVSAISNYDTDGYKFSLEVPLRQTLYVLMGEDEDFEKTVYFITDRLDSTKPIKDFLVAREKDNLDCKICVVGIGDRYDRDGLASISEEADIFILHCPDPLLMCNYLLERHGKK